MEILLGLTILGFLAFITYRERTFSNEKRQLINAMKSSSVQEFTYAEQVAEVKPKKEEEPPEFTLEQDLSDADFDKHIEETNNG